MSQNFNGKVVIVTGSSAGIGQATALSFSRAGASLVIHGQNEKRIQETKTLLKENGIANNKYIVVRGPVESMATLKEIVDKTVEAFGRIDVLVNNAGVMKGESNDFESVEHFDYLFAVNVRSAIQLTQLAAPHLAKTQGSVINLSSVMAINAYPENYVYGLTKTAIMHYTKNAAVKYGAQRIRVNCVLPGAIHTQFVTRHGVPQTVSDAIFNDFARDMAPLQRAGRPEEVASIIRFLASDEATYVNGAIWHVDGGATTYAQKNVVTGQQPVAEPVVVTAKPNGEIKTNGEMLPQKTPKLKNHDNHMRKKNKRTSCRA